MNLRQPNQLWIEQADAAIQKVNPTAAEVVEATRGFALLGRGRANRVSRRWNPVANRRAARAATCRRRKSPLERGSMNRFSETTENQRDACRSISSST